MKHSHAGSRTRPTALLDMTAFALALVTASLLTANPAAAGNGYDPHYRYCLQGGVSPSGPDIPDCSFTTYEQCRASASGYGYCVDNPVYVGATAQRPRVRTYR